MQQFQLFCFILKEIVRSDLKFSILLTSFSEYQYILKAF